MHHLCNAPLVVYGKTRQCNAQHCTAQRSTAQCNTQHNTPQYNTHHNTPQDNTQHNTPQCFTNMQTIRRKAIIVLKQSMFWNAIYVLHALACDVTYSPSTDT